MEVCEAIISLVEVASTTYADIIDDFQNYINFTIVFTIKWTDSMSSVFHHYYSRKLYKKFVM